ncbi:Splicing factor U2AF-associated protein 2 [Smittium mucronatum]|uniref:Splicing factor U2AF-associated protein 2 n=1 Tax=Smittium mucronatum TaxID=133383 RepID=A0A1R0H712_9FUNG|nr:Splicing factor U2AF-associated protein 2 [Smittium mucronatum]
MDSLSFPEYKDFHSDKSVRFEAETEKYVFKNESDSLEYEYDTKTKAWFPRWNESLISQQQSIYSSHSEPIVSNPVLDATHLSPKKDSKNSSQENKKQPRENTSIYVTGLPLDTTIAEVEEFFKKCGTIMPDLITGTHFLLVNFIIQNLMF